MAAPAVLILGARRSAVVPVGGAFAQLSPHALGAPVLRALLARAGVPADAVDLVIVGNALGAGGNPARLLALAAGLPERCAALSVDSQCDAGLDAVTLAASLIASGQAEVVVAGGVEAWSRAPLRAVRAVRPIDASQPPAFYDRPAFAPDPARDPDLLAAATAWAAELGLDRAAQDAWAVESHRRAVAAAAELGDEIEPVDGLRGPVAADAHPRPIGAERAARLPLAWRAAQDRLTAPGGAAEPDAAAASVIDTAVDTAGPHAPGLLAVAPRADGAALLLLTSEAAAQRLGVTPAARWVAGSLLGHAPEQPMAAAVPAMRDALRRAATAPGALIAVELHDAFAVQGQHAARALASLGLNPARLNRRGGGLARGHPIGASGAIALVRVLADLARDGRPGDRGLAAIAAAGGLGAAAVVERG